MGVVPAVRGLAVDGEPLPGDRLHALHDADVDTGVGQDGALFDVALDVGVRDRTPLAGVAVEADADELVGDGRAALVGELTSDLERDAADGHGRAEHVSAEPHAFFLGEELDLDVAPGLDAGVVEGAHHLDTAEHSEGSVEGSAGGHGVDVGAHQDTRQ
jgi:hypothetical protein